MNSVSIVTLTRFNDIFSALSCSIAAYEHLEHTRRIVVTSGEVKIDHESGWEVIEGIEPFIYARNANLGIQIAGRDDVLLVNDDVQIQSPIIDTLRQISHDYPNIGVLSPQIIGDGINNLQAMARFPLRQTLTLSSSPLLPFVWVYLPRRILDAVGLLDESFTGYGGDDEDWCLRALAKGFKLGITGKVKVKHGFGDRKYSSSFYRVMTAQQRDASLTRMRRQVQETHSA